MLDSHDRAASFVALISRADQAARINVRSLDIPIIQCRMNAATAVPCDEARIGEQRLLPAALGSLVG